MLQQHTQNLLHIVWATKNCQQILVRNVRFKLRQYLLEKSKDLGVVIKKLSIQPEHVHLFIDLPLDIILSDYMHELKGASSHWTNKNHLFANLFRWQKGFDVFKVSQEEIEKMMKYFEDQDEIHKNQSFYTEREELRRACIQM